MREYLAANPEKARLWKLRWDPDGRKTKESQTRYESANRKTRNEKARMRNATPEGHKKQLEAMKRWRELNPDKKRQATARWSETHPEKIKESHRRWRKSSKYLDWRKRWTAENRDKIRQKHNSWAANNREKISIKNRARRARKLQVNGIFSLADWRALVRASKRCHWCNKPFTKTRRADGTLGPRTHDHVIPLSKGGTHTIENSVCAHLSCNSAKRDRLFNPINGQGILL